MLDRPGLGELRARLIANLDTHSELEFKSMRSKLGLKKPKGCETEYQFNLEAGGEKKIKGNATGAELRKVLGNDLDRLAPEQLCGIIDDLIAYEKRDALEQRLSARYAIRPEQAADLADVTLEDGYAALSREAIRKLLPSMEKGIRFATAKKLVYGEYASRNELKELLPPVLQAVPQLRNPVRPRPDGASQSRQCAGSGVRQAGTGPRRIGPRLEAIGQTARGNLEAKPSE